MYSCQRYSVARCANFSSLGELLRGRFWIGNSVLLHLKEKKNEVHLPHGSLADIRAHLFVGERLSAF